MKRNIITLIAALFAMNAIYAQGDNLIPTKVIARRINSQGEITKEMPAEFTNTSTGKPMYFSFPEFSITSNIGFYNNHLTGISTYHEGGHPQYYDVYHWTYEGDRLTARDHVWGAMNESSWWQYEYDELNRLTSIERKNAYGNGFFTEYSYEYENDDRTVTETYMYEGDVLAQISVYQYDEAFNLESVYADKYNSQGVLTKTTLTSYTYTGSGQQETEVVQTLTEGEWANTSIMRYVYDEEERIVERQDGTWNSDLGEWDSTRKITFELLNGGTEYIVSFYKKLNGQWAWDCFNFQTILFGDNLEAQQMCANMMIYEEMSEPSRINQLVFTMENTDGPTYTKENGEASCHVYPNPAKGNVKVETPNESCVVRFYDLQGHLMTAKMFGFTTTINTESWQSGLYAWEVWHKGQKQSSGKWMKE